MSKQHQARSVVPKATYVGHARENKPGGGLTKTRHIWKMPKDSGFVTHFVNAGAKVKWASIVSPARVPTANDPVNFHKDIRSDAREPTQNERSKMLKRVSVYRALDLRTVKSIVSDRKRAEKLKARSGSSFLSMMKETLAGQGA